jgi:hypothetical protein
MKQHPIPQNILDIEFKLFTRFTLKEFIYVAIGIGFGGIFLFLFTKGIVHPGIAIPIFLLSSAIGLFLGLVPINDQKADVFLTNYFGAIRKPTQRVWKNKNFDQKFEDLAQERGIQLTQGNTDRTTNTSGKDTIIGGLKTSSLENNRFIEKQAIDAIDYEEIESIKAFEQIENELTSTQPTVSFEEIQTMDIQELDGLTPEQQDKEIYVDIPSELIPQQQLATPEINTPMISPQVNQIVISKETIMNYAIEVQGLQLLPSSINLQIVETTGTPINQAMVMIKDSAGTILQVIQSNQDGLVISNRNFGVGEFRVEISHDNYTFPSLYYILENDIYPTIRVSAN